MRRRSFVPFNKISYNMGGNIMFDSFEYGKNFLILKNSTQLHKQIYQQFLQHFSSNDSTILYIAKKNNQLITDFETRNIYFDKLNTESLHKVKTEIKKCAAESHKKAKPFLLICDWEGTDATLLPEVAELGRGGGERTMAGRNYKAKLPQTLLFITSSFHFLMT